MSTHDLRLTSYGLTAVVALLLLALGSSGADAQQGTPTVATDIPDPAECTIAPRSEDELRALFHEAEATTAAASPVLGSPQPAPLSGEPAAAPTAAAINATWRQYIACLNAGDQPRMFALLSDTMVRRQFVVDIAFGVTDEALFAFLAATPVPLVGDQSAPFVPLRDARVLGDGRVAALGPGEQGRGDVRIFVKKGDRWLIDDWYDLS